MTAQHTPDYASGFELPWRASVGGKTIVGLDGKGYGIATVGSPVHLDFIVRAVNSHALMERALADIRDEVAREDGGSHAVCAMIVRRFWREYEGDTDAG